MSLSPSPNRRHQQWQAQQQQQQQQQQQRQSPLPTSSHHQHQHQHQHQHSSSSSSTTTPFLRRVVPVPVCLLFACIPGIALQFLGVFHHVVLKQQQQQQVVVVLPCPDSEQPQQQVLPAESATLLRQNDPVVTRTHRDDSTLLADFWETGDMDHLPPSSKRKSSSFKKIVRFSSEQLAKAQQVGKSVITANSKKQAKRPRKKKYSPASNTTTPRYYEVKEIIDNITQQPDENGQKRHNSASVYSRANVVTKAYWFPPRKMCKETCCVETVAISLDQDDNKLINTEDGKDLADLQIDHQPIRQDHLTYLATNFREEYIPCLLPGTIIHIDNHRMAVKYFWFTVRPQIQTQYTLITSGSDDITPSEKPQYMMDPLLQKWYGTNPTHSTDTSFQKNKHKLVPMNLGLSYQHPQEKNLEPYLKMTNYTNPFLNLKRWDLDAKPLNFSRDVFVQFNANKPHRKVLWQVLCGNTTTTHSNATTTSLSCSYSTESSLPVTEILSDMSRFRFGISPTGHGWDCYRTYELLLLGVIPIVNELPPTSHQLFADLPVIQIRDLDHVTNRRVIENAIEDYLQSDKFWEADFERGWKRLFVRHRRRQILKDTGRDTEILRDEHGKEYYQGYKYSLAEGVEDYGTVYCQQENHCKYDDSGVPTWLDNPMPKMPKSDRKWLTKWRQLGIHNEIPEKMKIVIHKQKEQQPQPTKAS